MAQDEKWDYKGTSDKQILYNYLCYTYDRVKAENKIEISDDVSAMCFNTGLLENAVKKIVEKVKRNYKLAIPQYYTDKSTNEAKIQLLLPLFFTKQKCG